MVHYKEEGVFVRAGRINYIKTRIAIEHSKRRFKEFIGK
jgi:hypothetical protein